MTDLLPHLIPEALAEWVGAAAPEEPGPPPAQQEDINFATGCYLRQPAIAYAAAGGDGTCTVTAAPGLFLVARQKLPPRWLTVVAVNSTGAHTVYAGPADVASEAPGGDVTWRVKVDDTGPVMYTATVAYAGGAARSVTMMVG